MPVREMQTYLARRAPQILHDQYTACNIQKNRLLGICNRYDVVVDHDRAALDPVIDLPQALELGEEIIKEQKIWNTAEKRLARLNNEICAQDYIDYSKSIDYIKYPARILNYSGLYEAFSNDRICEENNKSPKLARGLKRKAVHFEDGLLSPRVRRPKVIRRFWHYNLEDDDISCLKDLPSPVTSDLNAAATKRKMERNLLKRKRAGDDDHYSYLSSHQKRQKLAGAGIWPEAYGSEDVGGAAIIPTLQNYASNVALQREEDQNEAEQEVQHFFTAFEDAEDCAAWPEETRPWPKTKGTEEDTTLWPRVEQDANDSGQITSAYEQIASPLLAAEEADDQGDDEAGEHDEDDCVPHEQKPNNSIDNVSQTWVTHDEETYPDHPCIVTAHAAPSTMSITFLQQPGSIIEYNWIDSSEPARETDTDQEDETAPTNEYYVLPQSSSSTNASAQVQATSHSINTSPSSKTHKNPTTMSVSASPSECSSNAQGGLSSSSEDQPDPLQDWTGPRLLDCSSTEVEETYTNHTYSPTQE